MMKSVLEVAGLNRLISVSQHQNKEMNSDFLYQNGPQSSDYLLKTKIQQSHSQSSRES